MSFGQKRWVSAAAFSERALVPPGSSTYLKWRSDPKQRHGWRSKPEDPGGPQNMNRIDDRVSVHLPGRVPGLRMP